jgi:hypothetical protein
VSSLALSLALDVFNIKLLLNRLKIIGLPYGIIQLLKSWLEQRFFFVSIDGNTFILFELLLGTIQGSVLGPVLYAIFVSTLFDIIPLLSFADESYTIKLSACKINLEKDMEKSLEAITKWLKKSGLKVRSMMTKQTYVFSIQKMFGWISR